MCFDTARMLAAGDTWFVAVIILAAGAPWIVAIAYYWPKVRRDGYVPPSLAQIIKERLWRRLP
jgi:hypothetical protein